MLSICYSGIGLPSNTKTLVEGRSEAGALILVVQLGYNQLPEPLLLALQIGG